MVTIKKKGSIRATLLLVITWVMFMGVVDASGGRGARENELSKNGAVHKERYDEILANLDKYAYVEDFRLTRYIPRDATAQGWETSGKSTTGRTIRSVHWFKEGENWVFSSASAERFEIAREMYAGKNFTESKELYNGDERMILWQMTFTDAMPEAERKTIMPYRCEAHIQYSGSPFTGAHGFVDWGSVAADVAHNGILKKDAKLFIAGYGKADVHDVGGGVRGRHIDLFMDNCEEGFAGGNTTGNLVIFEKDGSGITDGKAVTAEILDKVMNGKKWGDGGSSGGNNAVVNESEGQTGTGYKQWKPFKKYDISGTVVGVDTSQMSIPSESSYFFSVGAERFYKFAQKVMVVITALLVLFVALQVLGVVVLTRRTGEVAGVAISEEKIENFLFSEIKDGFTIRKAVQISAMNMVLLGFMVFMVLGSYYTVIQSKIYAGVGFLLELLF